MIEGYYKDHLAADRLKLVYELAPPRVKQYLEAEISFVESRLRPTATVLELGCGYGRILERLANKAKNVFGIDTSGSSLRVVAERSNFAFEVSVAQMDAVALGFREKSFDVVVCIQNGISAFHVDPRDLICESIRVTKRGGLILFSSYAEKFWEDRLEWFRVQSENGLIGEIDWDATHNGVIVCKDGFRASTFGPEDFASLVSQFGVAYKIHEVDDSSVFCEIMV